MTTGRINQVSHSNPSRRSRWNRFSNRCLMKKKLESKRTSNSRNFPKSRCDEKSPTHFGTVPSGTGTEVGGALLRCASSCWRSTGHYCEISFSPCVRIQNSILTFPACAGSDRNRIHLRKLILTLAAISHAAIRIYFRSCQLPPLPEKNRKFFRFFPGLRQMLLTTLLVAPSRWARLS